jgi:hypothetical protein
MERAEVDVEREKLHHRAFGESGKEKDWEGS